MKHESSKTTVEWWLWILFTGLMIFTPALFCALSVLLVMFQLPLRASTIMMTATSAFLSFIIWPIAIIQAVIGRHSNKNKAPKTLQDTLSIAVWALKRRNIFWKGTWNNHPFSVRVQQTHQGFGRGPVSLALHGPLSIRGRWLSHNPGPQPSRIWPDFAVLGYSLSATIPGKRWGAPELRLDAQSQTWTKDMLAIPGVRQALLTIQEETLGTNMISLDFCPMSVRLTFAPVDTKRITKARIQTLLQAAQTLLQAASTIDGRHKASLFEPWLHDPKKTRIWTERWLLGSNLLSYYTIALLLFALIAMADLSIP